MNPAPPVTKTLLLIILSGLLIVTPALSSRSHTIFNYHISIGNFAEGLKNYDLSHPSHVEIQTELGNNSECVAFLPSLKSRL